MCSMGSTICVSCLAGELKPEVLGDSAVADGCKEPCNLEVFVTEGILNDSSYDAVTSLSDRETGEHARMDPIAGVHRPRTG